ncbi:MAG: TonB-dependent receptor [Thiobacillus sp.]|nr:TonB-dependent receptor [Thiobacillus sp.]
MNAALPRLLAFLCLHAASPLLAQTPADAPATLETVQVTAPAYDADAARQESSAAKLIISREDLEKLDAATIGEILRQLPGVSLAADGGGRRGRGQPADRLEPRIIVDGEALPGGNRMALSLPVELIERIEIIRNSTAEFPAGPGGTINLILRDVPTQKTGTFRVGVSHNGDAFGGRIGGVYGAREGETGVLWMGFANTRPLSGERTVSAEHFSAGMRDDWDLETDRESGREQALHLAPRFTRDLDSGARLTLSPFFRFSELDRLTLTQRSTYTDPLLGTGLVGDGREREREATQRMNGRLAAEWKRRLPGAGEASARLSLQGESERRSQQLDTYDAADALVEQTRTRTTSNGVEISLTAKRSRPLADVHLATVGLEARHKDMRDRRRDTLNGAPVALGAQARADSREQLIALWGQDEWQVAECHLLTAGLRLQRSTGEVTDALDVTVKNTHTAWLPSLHYLWQRDPRWNLRASLALADAPPGVRALSPVIRTATGTNTLSNPDRAGNPALDAEQTATLQLGVEHFLPHKRGSAGLNLYLRQIDDKVQRLTQLEGARYVERPTNVGRADETSLVADFKIKPTRLPALTLRGNASTSRLSLDDPQLRQESPRHSGNLGFDYEHAPWRLTVGGNLSLSAAFSREASADTQLTQRARQQLDLYAVKKLDRQLSLRLSVDNLTRSGRGNDSEAWSGGTLDSRETDRADGVRVVFLSVEGKL